MGDFPDHAQLANLTLIEELYRDYLSNRESVESSWRHFFEGIDFATYLAKRGGEKEPDLSSCRILHLIQSYRRYGHLQAPVNPIAKELPMAKELQLEMLGFAKEELDQLFPTLGFCNRKEAPLQEIIAALHAIYCSRIGVEYMDLGSPEIEQWLQKRLEPQLLIVPSIEEKHLILESLNRSEVLETFLNTKYQGQTRFSLEGNESLIPLLAELIDRGA